jgi:membrane protein DedA with SNARE-associated domain
MTDYSFYGQYLEQFSYLGIFVVMVLAGHLVPLPEEILLLLVGYAAASGLFNVYAITIVAALGIVTGDNILYWLSLHGNYYIEKLKKRIKPEKLDFYEKLIKSHAGKTIFVSRFIVGMRFLAPLLAGSLKVKKRTFQFFNSLAVAIYVPFIIFLGYHFHNDFIEVVIKVKFFRHLIFLALLTILGLLISLFVTKKFLRNIINNGNHQ